MNKTNNNLTSGTNTRTGPGSIAVNGQDVLTIQATQMLISNVQTGGGGEYSDLDADFTHTANLFIDSATPGVYLTADSGHNYATPKNGVNPNAWTLYN